jgi:NADPH:quinone reductase-like Zn-dependent oxidoreductase
MKCIRVTNYGGPEQLKISEITRPRLRSGEVLIEVKACGINFADILLRKGLYPDGPGLPLIPGYEISGDIVALGSGVDPELMNQSVISFTQFNGYSEFVAVPVDHTFSKPQKFNYAESVAIPVAYCTAYQLLVVMGSLLPNETVLIHNAGGGVGLAAFEIAIHTGARIIGTASIKKHARLKKMGFEMLVDYSKEDWVSSVKKFTSGKGVDLIVDPIGGAHWRKSFKALGTSGRLGMYGISSTCENKGWRFFKLIKTVIGMPVFHALNLVNSNRGVFGVNMAHLWSEPQKIRYWMNSILTGIKDGWVHPHVDKIFSLEDTGAAHKYIENRLNFGKVILVPN